MSLRRTISTFCLLALALAQSTVALAQSSTEGSDDSLSGNPQVIMITSVGDIVLELDAQNAPGTVENFLAYADANFYTGTVFHRVIEGFMIQGGGFTEKYQRKTTRPPVSNEAYNGLQNRKYSIAMARTTAPHSATSQFFINTNDNPNLNHTETTPRGWGYTVFGRVVTGQEVVDTISRVKTSSGGQFTKDVPVEPIVIVGVERVLGTAASDPLQGAAKAVSPASKVIQDSQSQKQPVGLNVPKNPAVSPNTDLVNQN